MGMGEGRAAAAGTPHGRAEGQQAIAARLTAELKRRWQMLQEMNCFFLSGAGTPKVWLITAFCTGSICKGKHGVLWAGTGAAVLRRCAHRGLLASRNGLGPRINLRAPFTFMTLCVQPYFWPLHGVLCIITFLCLLLNHPSHPTELQGPNAH